jgi:hypothetical protein
MFMARLDSNNNDYEWGFTFQIGGHSRLFDSTLLHESFKQVDSNQLTRAKPVPKKVTRKIRRASAGQNGL